VTGAGGFDELAAYTVEQKRHGVRRVAIERQYLHGDPGVQHQDTLDGVCAPALRQRGDRLYPVSSVDDGPASVRWLDSCNRFHNRHAVQRERRIGKRALRITSGTSRLAAAPRRLTPRPR
jgi:hypothetical protein